MRELMIDEIEMISGGKSFFYWFGYVYGRGAKTQQYIDSFDSPMLGAMQYGA